MNINTFHNQEILKNIPLFNTLKHSELSNILSSKKNGIEKYTAKQLIIRQNDTAQCMYVILEGNVEVFLEGGLGEREFTLATLHAGDYFGELALMPDGPGLRNASVRSLHPSKLLRIDKEFVSQFHGTQPEKKINTPEEEIITLIKNMRLFQSVSEDEFHKISQWARIESFEAGEFIFKESETSNQLYIVLEGLVDIFTLDDDDKIVILKKLNRGRFFGEEALLPESNNTYNYFSRCDIKSQLVSIKKSFIENILARDKTLLLAMERVTEKLQQEISSLQ